MRDSLKKAVFHNVRDEAAASYAYDNGLFEASAVYDRTAAYAHGTRIISDNELAALIMKVPLIVHMHTHASGCNVLALTANMAI